MREQVHKQFLSSFMKISYESFSFQRANIFEHLVSEVHRLIAQWRVCLGFSSSHTLSTLSDTQTERHPHTHPLTHTKEKKKNDVPLTCAPSEIQHQNKTERQKLSHKKCGVYYITITIGTRITTINNNYQCATVQHAGF